MDTQREILLIKHSVERLENHFKVYKDDVGQLKDDFRDLKTAIIGSQINGNKGLIQLIDKISEKVDMIEDENILLKEHMKQGKWIAGIVLTALVGFMSMVLMEAKK
jgi:hypothetical protein